MADGNVKGTAVSIVITYWNKLRIDDTYYVEGQGMIVCETKDENNDSNNKDSINVYEYGVGKALDLKTI